MYVIQDENNVLYFLFPLIHIIFPELLQNESFLLLQFSFAHFVLVRVPFSVTSGFLSLASSGVALLGFSGAFYGRLRTAFLVIELRRAEIARGASGRGIVGASSSGFAVVIVFVVIVMPLRVRFLLFLLFSSSSQGMSIFVDFALGDKRD